MTTKGVILEQAAPSTTRIAPDGSGANPPLMPETEAEQGMWDKASPWVHGVLGVASFVPGLSVVTGALDAAIYTAEGELVEAGIAAASMIPGGKVVTTAGKAVKGAVGMARGTGTAARVVKGADAGMDVVDATRVAKEAREAKEAAETANAAARRPRKEVTIKGRAHKVPCFHPFDKKKFRQMSQADQKAYLKEMARQLKRQEDVLNSLTANEYKAARDAFAALNRHPAADMAQAAARKRFGLDVQSSIKESLQRGGMGARQARAEAAKRTETILGKLAALHEPDMVAGGWMHPQPTGMGRADVNSSIGGSWNQNGRVSGMDSEADRSIQSGHGDQKMNVRLEPCRGRGMR